MDNIQDWTQVVIRKPGKASGTKPHVSRPPSSLKTIETEEGEVMKLKTVSNEMAQFVIKARVDKGLKQSDLAKKACLDVKTVTEIERGGCVYNANDVNKIAKALGVKIPRS